MALGNMGFTAMVREYQTRVFYTGTAAKATIISGRRIDEPRLSSNAAAYSHHTAPHAKRGPHGRSAGTYPNRPNARATKPDSCGTFRFYRYCMNFNNHCPISST
ncbi:MAG: hypothetical protein KDC18_11395 [Alphaproteobacteria bacterium]|nr:hypothetical protein [Alphaproteobacteria bacterium]